jgi:hypothetical protein
VIHGRDESRRKAMFAFLRSIGLNPIEWSKGGNDTGSASPYNGQLVDSLLSQAVAVVVVLTPDDLAYLRADLISQATRTSSPRQRRRLAPTSCSRQEWPSATGRTTRSSCSSASFVLPRSHTRASSLASRDVH